MLHLTAADTYDCCVVSLAQVAPESADKAGGGQAAVIAGRGVYEGSEKEVPDVLLLEERQVVIFYFPGRNLVLSFGSAHEDSSMVQACREALLNRNSAVLCDLLGDTDGSDGCGTLMVVMLDASIDLVFPIMDVYGDALEGLRSLC